MNPNMTFEGRTKLAMELLAKQPPVTLNQARAQALWLKIAKDIKLPKSVVEALVELRDKRVKAEQRNDSILAEKLKQEEKEIFKTYPGVEEQMYIKYKDTTDKWN